MTLEWRLCQFCGRKVTPGGGYWYDREGWASSTSGSFHEHRPKADPRPVEVASARRSMTVKPETR